MKILFITPQLTMELGKVENIKVAETVLKACREEVEKYIFDSKTLMNQQQMLQAKRELNADTLIVLFNDSKDIEVSQIERFLESAIEQGCKIWPVAVNKESRFPIKYINKYQSYDVFEQLRCRNLNEVYLEATGVAFARRIISEGMPTFYREDNLLFVSHRRIDGEEVAAKLCDQLAIQSRDCTCFRDVVHVRVGEEAQEQIDKALAESDVLIYVHTERSAESDWIKKELIYALMKDIPIIWIRVGEADASKLNPKPSEKPHIECTYEDFEDQEKLIQLVDLVLEKSFETIMLHSNVTYDQMDRLETLCEQAQIEFNPVDSTKMIYKLVCPRQGYAYPQKHLQHYVQCYGRRHRKADITNLIEYIEGKEGHTVQDVDSILLLSEKVGVKRIEENVVEENYDDFFKAITQYGGHRTYISDDEIILSGSFPECDEVYKQPLYEAVRVFAKEIMQSGRILTFGAHPTFQETIFEIGKNCRPKDYTTATQMFISKWFQDKYRLNELTQHAKVIEVNRIDEADNRESMLKSLSAMREMMIGRPSVKAMICLGGIVREKGQNEGVIEEIRMAREHQIPVFLIGSVGGQSAKLASEYLESNNWEKLNNMPKELNEQLALSLDYRKMASKLISMIENQS